MYVYVCVCVCVYFSLWDIQATTTKANLGHYYTVTTLHVRSLNLVMGCIIFLVILVTELFLYVPIYEFCHHAEPDLVP